jgi:pimeloyl-ACP methyl ester carboxylesterase
MRLGTTLGDLRDDILATEVLDSLSIDVGPLRGVEVSACLEIFRSLGRHSEDPGRHGYHAFAYDWRRDLSEHAAGLDRLIRQISQDHPGEPIDIVAHSMGGLILRYYLRYGGASVPVHGTLPEPTWEGARRLRSTLLIGTPNAGSVQSLDQLVRGIRFVPLLTAPFRAAILGTMPSIYQLLPRPGHGRVVDAATDADLDPLKLDLWVAHGWGLADPREDSVLCELLPGVDSPARRRAVALEHLDKCLSRARQFFAAIDPEWPAPAEMPRSFLVAGDALSTADQLLVTRNTGRTRLNGYAPGDGVVSRSSALGTGWSMTACPDTAARWTEVRYLPAKHFELTRHHHFLDFVQRALVDRR